MGMRDTLYNSITTAVILCILSGGVMAAENEKPLTLQESIELVLKQSVIIHAAREGVTGAEAQKKEALTGFLPKLSTSYNYSRLNEAPTFLFPGVPPLVPRTLMTTGTRDNYYWTLEAKQPIFAGGGILANYEVNSLGMDIAKMDELATIQDIIQEVKVAYFHIIKAEKILEVAVHSVTQLKAHRDMSQHFFDVGMIPRNDLLHAEVELANGLQYRVRSENGVEMAKSRLNTILRRGIDTPIKAEDLLTRELFEKSLAECLKVAMENRPEIKAYALKVEQAKSMVKLARSEYFPNVNVVGNYTRFGDEPGVSGSPYRDQESWYVMAVANWNFWEWGKTKNRVDLSRSRENQSSDALTNIKDQITLEVKNAYLLLREAEKQLEVSKKAVEQAEENYRISVERYKEQVATSTDVLDAQTLLTRAKSDYTNALGDMNISRAKLERAMGVHPKGEKYLMSTQR